MSKCQNVSIFGVELLACVSPLHSVLHVVLADFTQFHRQQKERKNICLPVQCPRRSLALSDVNRESLKGG